VDTMQLLEPKHNLSLTHLLIHTHPPTHPPTYTIYMHTPTLLPAAYLHDLHVCPKVVGILQLALNTHTHAEGSSSEHRVNYRIVTGQRYSEHLLNIYWSTCTWLTSGDTKSSATFTQLHKFRTCTHTQLYK